MSIYYAWCQTCDPLKTTQAWTSGNKDVDDCIKKFQLKATSYKNVIEWIPFNKLDNVQKIGEGGFGSVFSATWLDGKRAVPKDEWALTLTQSRTPSCVVALKTLPGSQKNFLKEVEIIHLFYNIEKLVYGITQNTTNDEYLMVFQYANKGSLHEFLLSNFRELNWKSKLKQLVDISKNLIKLHEAEYIHRDFHSDDSIYGVLPYVAPEVLIERLYTLASDIYSFGIIMTEVSTGKPPHYKVEYDEILAIKICNGLRPEFAKGTPECYIQLANKCMEANPSNRPNAYDIRKNLLEWFNILDRDVAYDKNELTILKAFKSADEIIPTLSTELPDYSKDKLTSKLLNFKNLSEPINSSSAELPKIYG
ncbi:kinase-like domain-containing protein [Gigaspora rosea]|uniref:Kinase-like domain-containing protein n=1 Tax=Gigaspora rosea TaxID=44941 RepID=A0A397UQA1_9GLOM|nr:kinase-like domain-containing protein [Gigaspora rosea]